MSRISPILVFILSFIASNAFSQGIEYKTKYSWIALGKNDTQIAHAIVESSTCPHVKVDGVLYDMISRSKDIKVEAFDQITSCEFVLPKNSKDVQIDGVTLTKVSNKRKKIAIVGDTGCRVGKTRVQNCNNIDGYGEPWPFEKIAENIAKHDPDLIIHLGDYFYRDVKCPVGNKGCEGPVGDQWPTWEIEFFKPARSLLSVAPWVFIRGNHESCDKSYKGWFYLLSDVDHLDQPWKDGKCVVQTSPYQISTDYLNMLVMDTSTMPKDLEREDPTPDVLSRYVHQFNMINGMAQNSNNNWLLVHHPIYGIVILGEEEKHLRSITYPLQLAIKQSVEKILHTNIKRVISGHLHLFELLEFSDGRPKQIILGSGGTKIDPQITDELLTKYANVYDELNLKKKNFYHKSEYSFAIVELSKDGEIFKVYDVNNKLLLEF